MAGKKHKVAATSMGIVIGEAKQLHRYKLHTKLGSLIIGTIIFFILIGSGIYVYFYHKNNTQNESVTSQEKAKREAMAKFAKSDASKRTQLEAELNTANSPEAKAKIYQQLSKVAIDQGDIQQSQKYAQLAVDAFPSIDSYVALGFRAEQTKNYTLAAEMYGKAAALAKSSNLPQSEYDNYISMQQVAESKK